MKKLKRIKRKQYNFKKNNKDVITLIKEIALNGGKYER